MMICVGWTDSYNDDVKTVNATRDHICAIADRVRKREYNFSNQQTMLPYMSAAVFNDNTKIMLSSEVIGMVMQKAYGDQKMPARKTPFDTLADPVNGVLYEAPKFIPGNDNGNKV